MCCSPTVTQFGVIRTEDENSMRGDMLAVKRTRTTLENCEPEIDL